MESLIVVILTLRRGISLYATAVVVLLIALVSSIGVVQAQSDEEGPTDLHQQLEESRAELNRAREDLATVRALAFELELTVEFAAHTHNAFSTSLNNFWSETAATWTLYCYEQERKFLILYFSELDNVEFSDEQIELYKSVGDAILADDTDSVQDLVLEHCAENILLFPTPGDMNIGDVEAATRRAVIRLRAVLRERCLEKEAEQAVAYRLGSGPFTREQILRYESGLENDDLGPMKAFCADLILRIGAEYMAQIEEVE